MDIIQAHLSGCKDHSEPNRISAGFVHDYDQSYVFILVHTWSCEAAMQAVQALRSFPTKAETSDFIDGTAALSPA